MSSCFLPHGYKMAAIAQGILFSLQDLKQEGSSKSKILSFEGPAFLFRIRTSTAGFPLPLHGLEIGHKPSPWPVYIDYQSSLGSKERPTFLEIRNFHLLPNHKGSVVWAGEKREGFGVDDSKSLPWHSERISNFLSSQMYVCLWSPCASFFAIRRHTTQSSSKPEMLSVSANLRNNLIPCPHLTDDKTQANIREGV